MTRREHSPPLAGSMTALVTPFRHGEIDWGTLPALIEKQIDGGTDWLVACGTTAETPTLSGTERHRLLEAVLECAAGRCPVMAGVGSNCTATTVEAARAAASLGADALLVVTPYYNRPPQEGLFRHFAAVAESSAGPAGGRGPLPIVLYDVPARTGVHLAHETVVRLHRAYPHIAGLKDASGTVEGVTQVLTECEIAVLCGDDPLTWPMMAVGAVGVISVLSNLDPGLMKSLVSAARRRDNSAALAYHRKVQSLTTGLGRLGPNPLPIKTAMAVAGLVSEEFRLPLCPLGPEARRAVEGLLRQHEIIADPVSIL